jgi:hypothetical protein
MIYRLFYALFGLASGRCCRVCDDAIVPADPFGVSEGVCRGCRA